MSFQRSSPDKSFNQEFGWRDNLKTLCCLAPTTHLEPMQIFQWLQGKFKSVHLFWSPVSLNRGSFHRGHPFAPKSPPSILPVQVISILVQTTYTRSQQWYCPVTDTMKQTQGTLRRPINNLQLISGVHLWADAIKLLWRVGSWLPLNPADHWDCHLSFWLHNFHIGLRGMHE